MPPLTEQEIRQIVREELFFLVKSDRYIFEKLLQIADGRNIQLGRTTGTMIGTASDQKVGFYGVTPVIRQTAAQPYTAADIGGILKTLGLLNT